MAATSAQGLVDELVASGSLDDVAASLDAAELQAPSAEDPLLPPWPAAAHLLAHAGDAYSTDGSRTSLDDARFLWRRLPSSSREQPSTSAAFELLRALWVPDPVAAFEVLKSSFGGGDDAVAALAGRVAAGLRSRVAAVLPRCYSRIPLSRAAALLGFSSGEEDAVLSFVEAQRGWEVTGEEKVLVLPRPSVSAAAAKRGGASAAPSAAAAASAAASAEDELSKLASYVLQLEAGTA